MQGLQHHVPEIIIGAIACVTLFLRFMKVYE